MKRSLLMIALLAVLFVLAAAPAQAAGFLPLPPPPTLPFPDERVNQEQWATAAIYCDDNGYLDIYTLDEDGAGTLVIREVYKELQALGIPEVNTLRAQSADGSVRLYRLSSGEWQLNAPADGLVDGYVFRWTQCMPNAEVPKPVVGCILTKSAGYLGKFGLVRAC
jgi:hypothetical protein